MGQAPPVLFVVSFRPSLPPGSFGHRKRSSFQLLFNGGGGGREAISFSGRVVGWTPASICKVKGEWDNMGNFSFHTDLSTQDST